MTLPCVGSSVRSALALAAVAIGASAATLSAQGATGSIEGHVRDTAQHAMARAAVAIVGTSQVAITDSNGHYLLTAVPPGMVALQARFIGYKPYQVSAVRVLAGQTATVDFTLTPSLLQLNEITVTAPKNSLIPRDAVTTKQSATGSTVTALPVDRISQALALQPGVTQVGVAGTNSFEQASITTGSSAAAFSVRGGRLDQNLTYIDGVALQRNPNTESYSRIHENPFWSVGANPLSTFSIDVDHASYSNVRRFITAGQRPPADAVRIEEMINYFSYDYAAPGANSADPFTVSTEVGAAPWNPVNRLVRIGLQGRRIETANLPPSNLVFLLDVSGSMEPANRLPLVKGAMRLVVDQLRPQDRVSIVVYAGDAGIRLNPTSGSEKLAILDAIDRLSAGGSTNGSAGLKLAYEVARESRIPGGNNRIILATDGDFNVGLSSDDDMERLIEHERQGGTFLTVLGVGYGNLKDSKLEKIADKGNGNYAYLDNLLEAHKVLVQEMGGTLMTIAKDVKLQVEFNPSKVQAYRLIGYEDRMLQTQDFKDDRKDAGEMGAGHSVTALYEVVPVGVKSTLPIGGPDSLRYQVAAEKPVTVHGDELLFVKVRYKEPEADASKLLTHMVASRVAPASVEFSFAAAVAEFGMILRESKYRGAASIEDVLSRARQALGSDPQGYRAGFVKMVEEYQKLTYVAVEH